MINIGIIGTGFGAAIHIPGFRSVRGVRVLGIAGNSLAKTTRIAKSFGVPFAFVSWKELIDHPEIDAISIASPPHLHKDMVLYAARKRKHIFCEKPLAMSVTEGRAMLRAVQKARITHMVDFEFRNIPGLKTLAPLLEKKAVGTLRHINISWLTGGRASMDIPLSWQNDVKAGGGILFSHGSHVIDYVEQLFGKIKSVTAHLSIAKKNSVTAEDTCDLLCVLTNGVPVNISISNVLPNASGHMIEVYGDKGSLSLINSDLRNSIYGFRLFHFPLDAKKKVEISISVSRGARRHADSRLPLFMEVAEDFISAIKRGKAGNPSFSDGLRVQEVLDAARASDKLKREITT